VFAEQPGHLACENLAEQRLQLCIGALLLLRRQPLAEVEMWQQVDVHHISRLPVGRDLQNRRAGEPAMGEQDVFAKALAVAADQAVLYRGAGQLGADRLELRLGDGERHQSRACRQHVVAELARDLITEAAGAEGRNRQAAGGDYQRLAAHRADAGV